MTDLDKAWLAGIIDGEGSIFIMQQRRNDRDRDINYILRISVESTDPFMATECQKIAGGPKLSQKKDSRPNMSDTLKWQLNGKKAAALLQELLPFLRVKHEQAKLAIEFQSSTKKHWKHMKEQDYMKQKQLCMDLKKAKQSLKLGRGLYGSAGA